MAAYNAYPQSNINYIPGSAAPKYEPEYAPRKKAAPKPAAGKNASEKRQKTALQIYLPSLCLMLVMLAGLTASIIWQISVTASITSSQDKIEAALSELNTLTADNDAKEIYMNKSVDLNQIYEVATNELGMVYPSYDQIVYYTRKDTGYVRQYEDIPQS